LGYPRPERRVGDVQRGAKGRDVSEYRITVEVRFDPCALQPHDFHLETFGLAALTMVETCARCGAVKYPRFEIGGIDRSPTAWWNA
jgi:hypothetical protein